MVKPPVVKMDQNHRSEVLFWVINAINFFALWFILFPSKLE